LPDGQNHFASAEAQGFNTLHAGVDRFHEASLLQGNAVRDANGTVLHDPIHHSNVLSESATGRFKSSCATDFLISRALGEGLVLAIETLTARDVVEDHNAVARAVGLDAFADRRHHAGGLVAEDARGGMRTGGDLLEVGAADTAGVNANEHFSGANGGYWNSLEADIIHAAVDGGLHNRGNRMLRGFDRVLSG
jgi:hypothetical protein